MVNVETSRIRKKITIVQGHKKGVIEIDPKFTLKLTRLSIGFPTM